MMNIRFQGAFLVGPPCVITGNPTRDGFLTLQAKTNQEARKRQRDGIPAEGFTYRIKRGDGRLDCYHGVVTHQDAEVVQWLRDALRNRESPAQAAPYLKKVLQFLKSESAPSTSIEIVQSLLQQTHWDESVQSDFAKIHTCLKRLAYRKALAAQAELDELLG